MLCFHLQSQVFLSSLVISFLTHWLFKGVVWRKMAENSRNPPLQWNNWAELKQIFWKCRVWWNFQHPEAELMNRLSFSKLWWISTFSHNYQGTMCTESFHIPLHTVQFPIKEHLHCSQFWGAIINHYKCVCRVLCILNLLKYLEHSCCLAWWETARGYHFCIPISNTWEFLLFRILSSIQCCQCCGFGPF